MKSFHFYRQYYKGEYDKYSPFVACCIACLEQEHLELKFLEDSTYAIYNKFGGIIGLLFFDKKKEHAISVDSSIIISSSEIIVEFNNNRISFDDETTLPNIKKAIRNFLKSSSKHELLDDWTLLENLLKKDYNNYLNFFEENQNRHHIMLKDSAAYFENSLPKSVLVSSIKDYLFCHTIFHYCIESDKTYKNLLIEDEIYLLFSQTYQTIAVEILSEKVISIIKKIAVEVNDIEIFLNSLLALLNTICRRKPVKLEARNTEYLNKSTWAWIENKAEEIKSDIRENKTVLVNSTPEVLQICEILKDAGKIRLSICAPNTFDFYLSKILLTKLSNAKVYLLDIAQKLPKKEENRQQIFFDNTFKRNGIPKPQSFDYAIIDFLNHPISNIIETQIVINNAHRRISLKNKMIGSNIIEIGNLLKTNGLIDMLTNNHLLYNSILGEARLRLSKVFDITMKERDSSTYIEKAIFLTLKKGNTNNISYQKIDELGQKSSSTISELENTNIWFNKAYLEKLKLYSPQKTDKTAVYIQLKKGAFYNEKKVPKLTIDKTENNISFITKPFGGKVALSKNERKEFALETNQYLNLGANSIGNKAFVIATDNYPVFHFISKLVSLALFKSNPHQLEFNISDYAYSIFRKDHVISLEKRFSKNLLLKDKALKTSLDKLFYLTESLPVLKKFVVQLQKIADKNREQRISYELLVYAEIIEKFNKKRSILSKNAKERKRLLNSISTQLKQLKKILQQYATLEINCQKELIALSKENIFYYCLALLNSKAYQHSYSYYMLYDLPRIYYSESFYQYVLLGKKLFNLFQGNFSVKNLLKVTELDIEHNENKQLKIKLIKRLGCILVNDCLEISGISQKTWDYQINGKSPIEWRVEWLRKKYKQAVLNQSLKEEIVKEITLYNSVSLEIQTVIQQINELQLCKN